MIGQRFTVFILSENESSDWKVGGKCRPKKVNSREDWRKFQLYPRILLRTWRMYMGNKKSAIFALD
jgi:hypothetical protein